MTDPLPPFVYHPDPVATGSVVVSDEVCVACGRARGYIYDGLPFAREELESCICPWCIADGSAAGRFRATFNDLEGEEWREVPEAVIDEVLRRTPGFTGWQQERWFAHCRDAMVFLGPAGFAELSAVGAEALEAVADELRTDRTDDGWLEEYLHSLDRDGEPTAYLFRCRHCGAYRGYSDFT